MRHEGRPTNTVRPGGHHIVPLILSCLLSLIVLQVKALAWGGKGHEVGGGRPSELAQFAGTRVQYFPFG